MEAALPDGLVSALWRFLAVVSLLMANGIFVAIEFALVSTRQRRMEELARNQIPGARLALRVLENPDRVLAAAQLGITMASLALGWVGEPFVADLLAVPLGLLPLDTWVDMEFVTHTLSVIIAFTLITSCHIVLGEQAPKIYSIGSAERTIIFLAPFIIVFDKIFGPFIHSLDRATTAVLKLVGTKPISSHHRAILSIEELKRLVSDSQEDGVLEENEEIMLRNVFEFADRQVSEAMVPRLDIVAVDVGARLSEFLAIYTKSPHSRYPLYEGTLDNIRGFVPIKDVLHFMAAKGVDSLKEPLSPLMRPVVVVPVFKLIGELFEEMQEQGLSLAVVVDEYGATVGMVTPHELLEKIVGRLRDEAATNERVVSQLDEKTAVVYAQLSIEEVNSELCLDLPENPAYETLAGLILYELKRFPKVGEELVVTNVHLTVTEMIGTKIEKVVVKQMETPEAAT